MSNGYLLAAEADIAAAREMAAGFGLETIDANTLGSQQAAAAALAGADNVGIVISHAATRDAAFVALTLALSTSLRTAQIIVVEASAREAFPFLPSAWPTMTFDEARSRSAELVRRRAEHEAAAAEPPRAHPLPPPEPPPSVEDAPPAVEEAPSPREQLEDANETQPTEHDAEVNAKEDLAAADDDSTLAGGVDEAPQTESFGTDGAMVGGSADRSEQPLDQTPAPPASIPTPAPAPQPAERRIDIDPPRQRTTRGAPAASASADATAFAPKKLRRGSPELVRIVIHQPQDLQDVIKAARKLDPRTEPAPSGMHIGDVPIGSSVGVSLEVRGATCDGAMQRRVWTGDAIDFNFCAEPDADVRQAVFLARVFVNDAQIGVLAFTRPVGGANKKPHSTGDRIRLKRHKRVFLSYSSKDRETVSAIATAYAAAGIEHFFDRTSLKSGEEWSPRLRREIERADLFHLCWSKSAAASEWVEKEAEHALTRRHRSNGKRPDITVQMLDGPPWAPHPPHLDSINFDDFVRAAIVGYARGDGDS
jgi:hypothetical protein